MGEKGRYGLCVIVSLLAGILSSCEEGSRPFPEVEVKTAGRPVRVEVARAPSAGLSGRFAGTVRAPEESEVAFRVPGTIQRIEVDIGAPVRRGERLATLDASEYRIALRRARAELRGARARLRQAASEAERVEALFEARAATERQLEQARQRLESRQSAAAAARRAVERARLRLGYATLEAPVAGFIADRFVDSGETVQAGEPVVTITTSEEREIRTEVPSTVVTELALGDPASVLLTRTDQELSGVVSELAQAPDRDAILYPVVIELEDPPDFVRPGMTAAVRFPGAPRASPEAPRRGVLVSPAAVVGDRAAGLGVFVLEPIEEERAGEGRQLRSTEEAPRDQGRDEPGERDEVEPGRMFTARRRDVTVARVTDDGILISRGVEPGDQVVTAGADGLEDGERVKATDDLTRVPDLTPQISSSQAGTRSPVGGAK